MKPAEMTISGRTLGVGHPVFVIAEIGVNHDGSVQRALELVEQAARAGADAVKLQVFSAAALMHSGARFAEYQKERCDDADPARMLKRCELSDIELVRVVEEIEGKRMVAMATPFSPADVPRIEQLGLGAVKIASPDLVNRPLLESCAKLGQPLLVSTGAATMEEVGESVRWLRDWHAPFALLHCVSSYPTRTGEAHLGWMQEMADRFDVPIGYSDHTTELLAGALAVAAGACIIEKHLTYDPDAAGPDHAASAGPQEFEQYVRSIRLAERMLGGGGKRVLEAEQDVRTVSRQSLVLTRGLIGGQEILEGDLTVQRPGTGIPAAKVREVVGRRVRQAVVAGTMLQWDMLAA